MKIKTAITISCKNSCFDHLPFKQTYVPNGMASDLEEECKRYEGILAANPVDLQILGIGENGHIGFNEPGTPFNSPTNIVELTESTRQANLRFFEKKKMCQLMQLQWELEAL